MKVALVNLCKIEDFSKTGDWRSSLAFLKENNIDYVDYFSGKETPTDLLNGFYEALANKEVELIWFIQGGNDLITFLDKIDWKLVKKSNKEYLGLSDFTHFVFKAMESGKTCYYGPGLSHCWAASLPRFIRILILQEYLWLRAGLVSRSMCLGDG